MYMWTQFPNGTSVWAPIYPMCYRPPSQEKYNFSKKSVDGLNPTTDLSCSNLAGTIHTVNILLKTSGLLTEKVQQSNSQVNKFQIKAGHVITCA